MRSDINILCYFIKFLGINLGLSICYCKLIYRSYPLKVFKTLILILFNAFSSIFQCILQNYIPRFFIILLMIFLHGLFLGKLFKIDFHKSLSIDLIALSITYSFSQLSSILAASVFATFENVYYIDYICVVLMSLVTIILIFLLFKLKRLKHGFSFLKNDYLSLLILLLAIIFVFTYSIISHYSNEYLFATSTVILILFFIIIKQSFIIYQKQKLQTQALKDYEKELAETKQKLQAALEEKEKISKVQHDFKNLQDSLKSKLAMLAKSNFNAETSEEFASIIDRIDTLSDEYYNELKTLPNLPKTGIERIDDILKHMQIGCSKYNIEFVFELKCNIHKIIENYISVSKLEILLGNLLKNAIIAINHSTNSYKSIMLVFGLKHDFYEIDIFDSGINFEIDTLLNLGINKCSTHLDEGGNGYGLMSIFETLSNCNASLIIDEFDSNDYSKMIGIRFDDLSKYVINSYRAEQIASGNTSKREIEINNN